MVTGAMKNKTYMVEIDTRLCKSCGICVYACARDALAERETGEPEFRDPARCTGCRLCETMCPDFAIRVREG